jgi:hypothetical protein
MTQSVEETHINLCPKSFIRYKNDCYYHSSVVGDYNSSELNCAARGSRIIAIKDRATYQFIRMWAAQNKFGDFFLGLNYTTGNPDVPIRYSDGTQYNKSIHFAFDESAEKFGRKECSYMKKGVMYKPRDSSCLTEMDQICQWNSKYQLMNMVGGNL